MKNSAEDSAISNLEADAWNGTQHGMEGSGGQWGECSHRGSGVLLWGWASILVLQQGQTPSPVCWYMLLKACELLCLLDPVLSVSFHFSPFLSFSSWDGCTLIDTAVSSSDIGLYCIQCFLVPPLGS